MMHAGADTGMWDEEDGFFYDVLRSARRHVAAAQGPLDGRTPAALRGDRLRGRSCWPGTRSSAQRMRHFLEARPELRACDPRPSRRRQWRTGDWPRSSTRRSCAACSPAMLDESEFLSALRHPLAVALPRGAPVHLRASTGRSSRWPTCRPSPTAGMFGGNSNWRGPIWMPVNALIIRALLQYHSYYGDAFTVECPTGSGQLMTLYQVAEELGRRLGAHLPPGRDGPAAGLRRHRRSSRTIPSGATTSSSTSTSTATTAPASAPATRPAGPASSPGSLHLFATTSPDRSWPWACLPPWRSERPGRAGDPPLPCLTALPRYPSLYQINTRVWLTELAAELGRPATLDDVPDEELDAIAAGLRLGLAAERLADRRGQPGGVADDPGLRREFQATLPDLRRRYRRVGVRLPLHGRSGPRRGCRPGGAPGSAEPATDPAYHAFAVASREPEEPGRPAGQPPSTSASSRRPLRRPLAGRAGAAVGPGRTGHWPRRSRGCCST